MDSDYIFGFNWKLLVRTILKPLNILIFVNVALLVAFFTASGVDIIYHSDPDYSEWRRSMETHFPHDPILMLIGLQCITGAVFFLVMIAMVVQEILDGFTERTHRRAKEMMDKELKLAEKAEAERSFTETAAWSAHHRTLELMDKQIELERVLRMAPATAIVGVLDTPSTELQTPTTEEVQ